MNNIHIILLIVYIWYVKSKLHRIFLQDSLKDIESPYHLPDSVYKPFGKAYVITTERKLPKAVIHAARACGFEPVILEADRPFRNLYPNTTAFTSHCFGGKNVEQPINMSPGEVALVGSHRKAIKLIANDSTIFDDDWSLILESDAHLHPDAKNPREMIAEAIIHQKLTNSYGFMYLGACSPKCSKPGDAFSDGCIGYCTHALAITKKRAQTFFEELYCTELNKRKRTTCGCHKPMCHTDQTLVHHFKDPVRNGWDRSVIPRAMLIGPNLKSPHIPDHYGLLYQCCRDEVLIKSGNGSSLKVVELRDAPPLDCYNTRLDGRMGNLLFEYASLIGICVKRGFPHDTCAGLPPTSITGDRFDLPVEEFRKVFDLPEIFCPINESFRYREHEKEKYAIKFDPDIFNQPPGTLFEGYLQSYKYFHPHAREQVRNTFQFPAQIRKTGDEFLKLIHHNIEDDEKRKNITCIHVRRGDKARSWNKGSNSIYNPWALSVDFYLKAMSYARTWTPHLNMVFFVGGGFYRKEFDEDRTWVREKLMSRAREGDRAYLAPDELSHMTVMYILSSCDHLVISSSSFSWWAGYLSSKQNPLVIAPKYLHTDEVGFEPHDHYLPEWILLDKQTEVPQKQWTLLKKQNH